MIRHDGFSLLELLIVVAIILIISTIAIPTLLHTRQAANESSAVANLRTIFNAEGTYILSSSGRYGGLSELVAAGLMDTRFSGANSVSGYDYSVSTYLGGYTATALPASTNGGRYGYYMTTDAIPRYFTTSVANCNPCYPTNLAGEPVR